MIQQFSFSRLRLAEVLLFTVSIAILVTTYAITYSKILELTLVGTFIATGIVLFFALRPIIHLDNYLKEDADKVFTYDEGSQMVEYKDTQKTQRFEFADIILVTRTYSSLNYRLCYYTITIKDQQPIRVSIFIPINYIIDYAKSKSIYNEERYFNALMD